MYVCCNWQRIEPWPDQAYCEAGGSRSHMSRKPQADWTGYGAIILASITLCAAWLMSGSIWLTMAILMLGMLHIGKEFPAIEAVIAQDPLLVWLRRVSPLIVLGIFAMVMILHFVR
jgi:hypothetical protein